jgi:tetrahydromethanopterin S-methyltransferase subunit H
MKDDQRHGSKETFKWPPLAGDYVIGNSSAKIAVMTCGSYDMPEKIVEARRSSISIAGFCETENEGLAKIVQNVVSNSHIRRIIICGERVRGHEPGQTLVALHLNGLNQKYAVIGSNGTIPTLLPTYFRGDDPLKYVSRFQQQIISVTDMIDETSLEKIKVMIDKITAEKEPASVEMEPIFPPQPSMQNNWRKATTSFVKKAKGVKMNTRGSLGSMFTFTDADLLVYDLCGLKVGGQRGEYPTVMAGTIFYTKDKTVSDPKAGVFDKKAAADSIHRQDELSIHYNIPAIVHVVGQTAEAIERYILFVVDHSDSPIIIDSSSMDVRLRGIRLAKDIGVGSKAIYNSIIAVSDKERDVLKDMDGAEYAICLSYEDSAESSVKKTTQVQRYFKGAVQKWIIDPGVPRLGMGALSALERAWILKNRLGFPTAIGIHNLHSSQAAKEDFQFDFDYTLPTIFGVDMNLYGPIKNAVKVFPKVAAAQVAVADEQYKILGVLPRRPHPYYDALRGEVLPD